MEKKENKLISYKPAAETIKTAILQEQYEVAKGITFFDIQKAYCRLWQSNFSNGYCHF